MMRKVVYRTNNDSASGRDGEANDWYGEDDYEVGQRVMGKEITMIGKMYDQNNAQGSVGIFFGTPVRLFCEIPMTSVARIYYSLEE